MNIERAKEIIKMREEGNRIEVYQVKGNVIHMNSIVGMGSIDCGLVFMNDYSSSHPRDLHETKEEAIAYVKSLCKLWGEEPSVLFINKDEEVERWL